MADRPSVLIAALSGRALAAAARRAGRRPLIADLFHDMDTRRIATASARVDGDLASGLDADSLLVTVDALAKEYGGRKVPLVYGAGLEDRTDVLAALGEARRILGNPAEVVQRAKDPRSFFPQLRRLGLRHPETRISQPSDTRGWIAKRIGASGGGHIRAARGTSRKRPDVYYQRQVAGQPVSACFLANGRHARLIGFSAPIEDTGRRGFRFAGAAQPAEPPEAARQSIVDTIAALTRAFGLVGLNSADFILGKDGPELLEVNPRLGATVDIFDRVRPAYLFQAHCDACRGTLPRDIPTLGAAACAVIYADTRVSVGKGMRWPRWAADIPPPGTTIGRNEPVCTVLSRADSAARASALLAARSASIRQMLARPRERQAAQTISAPEPT